MVQTEPPADVLERLERAEQMKIDGKFDEALELLEELLFEDPENVSALEEVADNELSLHHYDRSEAAASEAIALDAQSYTGYYIIGFLHSHREEWTQSITALRKANAIKANCPEILRCLGWALFCDGQHAQGVVTLERSLNLDPENTLTLCDLGFAHLQVHHFEKARSLFARALDLEPQNLRARECIQALERMLKTSEPIKQG
jgi:tetratricopeptide (TPR) repeat protein